MKRILPPLLVLPLLLGACATSQQPSKETVASSSGFARQTGSLATAWGKLPTYSHQPEELQQFKSRFSWLPVLLAGIDNTATVDVLVNRDGTVRDVAIVESSGNPAKDSTVKPSLDGVRIATKIAPEDPAPYVFRTLVVFHKAPGYGSDYSSLYPETRYTEGIYNTLPDWVR
jgi:TonB family protein